MRFDVIKAREGVWRWRLVSDGASTVAVSPTTYATRAECLYAVALAMSAHGADVEETEPATLDEEKPLL